MAAKRRQGKPARPATLAGRLLEAARYVIGQRESLDYPATTARPEDQGFRRLTARSPKELSTFQWRKQMAVAHHLWLNNAMGKRIVEIFTDFVVGDGFIVQAKDPSVREVVDKHWTDPDNAWDLKMFERAQELGLFGLVVLRAFVAKENGHVKLSPVDPAWITELVPSPNKADQVQAIKVNIGGAEETLKVIQKDTNPQSPTFGRLVGDCFYFAVNKLSYTMQGVSDLYQLADWLDAYDQFVFHSLERIVFLNAHLYDITLEGANDDVVKARASDLERNPPKAGGFRVHDEKEKWEALAPKINTAEVEELSRLVKLLILGAAGIPEHWFSFGGDANRATAESMNVPIFRKVKRRQAQWRDVLTSIVDFVIDQAIIAGRLAKTVDKSFSVIPSDVSQKDAKASSDLLSSLTDTLVAAQNAGYVKPEVAAKMWASQASDLGADVEAPSGADVEASAKAAAAARDAAAGKVEASAYAKPAAAKEPAGSAAA